MCRARAVRGDALKIYATKYRIAADKVKRIQ